MAIGDIVRNNTENLSVWKERFLETSNKRRTVVNGCPSFIYHLFRKIESCN